MLLSRCSLATLAIVVVITSWACGEPLATSEPVILRVSGSTDLEGLVHELADAYMARVGGVSFQVSGGGTTYGLGSLRRGESHVAMVSWLPSDLGSGWKATRIARDGLAIVVHSDNPVQGIGYLQLQDLFAGRITDWGSLSGRSTGGGVQPVVREDGSGARAGFDTLVMAGLRQTPWAVVVTSSSGVIEYVAGHPEAVGYVSHRELTMGVKGLTLEGFAPSAETVGQGTYPLTRELWLVTHESPSPEAEAFVTFATSPAGQEIAERWLGHPR